VSCDPESTANSRSSNDVYETESVQSERLDSKVERVHLEWQGLCCSYNGSNGKIVVLADIWGQALPGEMQVCACAGGGQQRTAVLGSTQATAGQTQLHATAAANDSSLGSCRCCCCLGLQLNVYDIVLLNPILGVSLWLYGDSYQLQCTLPSVTASSSGLAD